jgi:hypothetical protein
LWKEKNSDDFMLETDGLTLWKEKKFHWKLLYNLNLKLFSSNTFFLYIQMSKFYIIFTLFYQCHKKILKKSPQISFFLKLWHETIVSSKHLQTFQVLKCLNNFFIFLVRISYKDDIDRTV